MKLKGRKIDKKRDIETEIWVCDKCGYREEITED